jgi:hypothetical protein
MGLNIGETFFLNGMQDLSNPILIDVDGGSFVILFKDEGSPTYRMSWSGRVLPVYLCSDDSYYYRSDKSSDLEDDINKAEVAFEFSFCWRGVWGGRVYPKRVEYWNDDIRIMADVWDKVEKILKERIKAENPDYAL